VRGVAAVDSICNEYCMALGHMTHVRVDDDVFAKGLAFSGLSRLLTAQVLNDTYAHGAT
jgi:hypothetical protein